MQTVLQFSIFLIKVKAQKELDKSSFKIVGFFFFFDESHVVQVGLLLTM